MKYAFEQIWQTYADGHLAIWVSQERQFYLERLGQKYFWYIQNSMNDLGEDWKSSQEVIIQAQLNGEDVDLEILADLRDLYQIMCRCLNQIIESHRISIGSHPVDIYRQLSSANLQMIRKQCEFFISDVSALFPLEIDDWGRAASGLAIPNK